MAIPNKRIPILALRNTVLFPMVNQLVKVGREKSMRAVQQAQDEGKWIIAVTQKQKSDDAGIDDLYQVGTLCKIESVRGTKESGFQVLLRGEKRVKLIEPMDQDGFLSTQIEAMIDLSEENENTARALLNSLKEISYSILALVPANTDQLVELVRGVDDLGFMSFLAAANIDIPIEEKQKILEMDSIKERVMLLLQQMQNLKEELQVQADIRGKLASRIGSQQRQTILREQMRAIQEELGENAEGVEKDYRQKFSEAGLSGEALKIAEQELRRLESMGSNSPESHIIRNYLDFLCALPWTKIAESKEVDLDAARKILDQDHYGLEKIKKRILEHLAILNLRKDKKGSILLFVGPPGVGKTSLGQSIAKALGRKYVRASLGGVRDDAEIRGHRRTYIGALPGRILTGIRRAGEKNPVFILDEIDKLSRSFAGDPASALLEVLDPEQNTHFLDHYLDTAFDLSEVFFIATANSLDGIPGPLLDRMEVIELSGYTLSEKLHIAKRHLVPKALSEHGMTPEKIEFSDESLLRMIAHYTREAGVRELKRQLDAVIRAQAEKVVRHQAKIILNKADIEEALGPERYTYEVAETNPLPGVVTGLAWTPVGGDILFVESSAMPGSGKLILTGQLGDVMKESAQIALSLLRSRVLLLHTKFDINKIDIHLHVPAGAIPKDGPSAGVTMLTSLASLFTAQVVNPKLAMTGEISLRGTVMPVGGIKEKVIAAQRAGIEKVILSKKNAKDLKDVPDEVKNSLKFVFVENVQELLFEALHLEVGIPKIYLLDEPPVNPSGPSVHVS